MSKGKLHSKRRRRHFMLLSALAVRLLAMPNALRQISSPEAPNREIGI
jgi:hypothetical protein